MQCNQAVIRKTQGTNHPGGLQRLTIFASIQAVVGADNSYMMHTHPPDANLLLFGSDAASAYKEGANFNFSPGVNITRG